MTRKRSQGGHRRAVKRTQADARRRRIDLRRSAEEREACQAPGPCPCPGCVPEEEGP